jgi:hypothetical protein
VVAWPASRDEDDFMPTKEPDYARLIAMLFAAVVVLTGIAGIGMAFRACGSAPLFPCGDEIVGQYPSPDGRRKVLVYVRDCGATTSWATHAVIASTGNSSTDREPVFVADRDHGAAPAGPAHGPELRVRWLDQSSVVLSYDPRARVFRSVEEADGVRIRYEAFSDNQSHDPVPAGGR